jgi:hypothetical protein
MPTNAVEIDPIRTTHQELIAGGYLRIYRIGDNTPYLRWELPADGDVLARLWAVLRLERSVRGLFAARKAALLARLRPVFVERRNGLHFGRWAHDLCARMARGTGLFVQMFGALLVLSLALLISRCFETVWC